MKATIYDVARDAGVGISTVSRVMNDSPSVSAETRERVLASIKKLHFYPNANARGLTSSKITTIGIMVPFYFKYFFMEILLGIGDELSSHGYDFLLYNVDEPGKKARFMEKIMGERKIGGLIMISLPLEDNEFKELQIAKIPLVLLDSQYPHANSIYVDNTDGAYKAVNHLIQQGHRRIAIINGDMSDPLRAQTARERLTGYKRALRDADIEFDRDLVRTGHWNKFSAYEAMEVALEIPNPPTAAFCTSDVMALGAMEKVKKRGMTIPEEFAIVGYDDMEFAQYAGLTTMRQPLDIVGEMGAKILLGAMAENKYKKQHIRFEPELVVRFSSMPERRGQGKQPGDEEDE